MALARCMPRVALALLLLAAPAVAEEAAAPGRAAIPPQVTVYKTATCGCCGAWARHLEAEGFLVRTRDVTDLAAVKRRLGVPAAAEACHTAVVDGYVIEGHVPAEDVARLLAERPRVRGLAVPGMPLGSPGMESDTPEPYDVRVIDDGGLGEVFAHH